jgi:putative ABC transport system permease protein
MLAAETVLLLVVATLPGTVIGVGFAWVGYKTFVKRTLSHEFPDYPWTDFGGVNRPSRAAVAGRRRR